MSKKSTKKRPHKLHIKKGDRVVVIAGRSKGQEGEVMEVHPSKNTAIVEGVNIVHKHTRPTETEKGSINKIPGPIHLSNLMHIDPQTGERTRIGRKLVDGKLVRYSKKSGEIIS